PSRVRSDLRRVHPARLLCHELPRISLSREPRGASQDNCGIRYSRRTSAASVRVALIPSSPSRRHLSTSRRTQSFASALQVPLSRPCDRALYGSPLSFRLGSTLFCRLPSFTSRVRDSPARPVSSPVQIS